MISDKIF